MCENQIVVVLEGGLVQDISGLPAGWTLEVRDYDIEGSTLDDLSTDSAGAEYVGSIYESDQCITCAAIAPVTTGHMCAECLTKAFNSDKGRDIDASLMNKMVEKEKENA